MNGVSERDYPFAGHPRQFVAAAMPNGDARSGVAGPLVFVCEQRGGCIDRPKYLSRAEAEQLHSALGVALRTFARAAEMAQPGRNSDAPAAYLGPYPIRDHGTLADHGFCDADETPESEAA